MDVDLLWLTLLSSCEAGYILCASTGADEALVEPVGLVSNHAYAVTRYLSTYLPTYLPIYL